MDTEQPAVDSEAAALSAMEEKLFGSEPEVAEPEQDEEQVTEEAQPTEEELFDIEADDGEKYRVPQKLRDSFLRQQDYTRKTQELSELRKQAALTAEAVHASQAFQASVSTDQQELAKVQMDIERLKQIDWTQLDTDNYIRVKHQMDALKERAQEISGAISTKAHQFSQWQQSHKANLTAQGLNYLKQTIPGWGQQHVGDAAKTALDVGYTSDEVSQVYDPRFVRLAWEAAQYRKLQSGKGAAVEAAQKAPPVIKPGSSDPAMSAKMQKLNWAKQMKQAKSPTEKRGLAEARMAKFFGA